MDYTRESYSADPLAATPSLAVTNTFLGASVGDDFSHKLGSASLFTQRFNYYPNLNNGGGYRTALDLGFTAKLTPGWDGSWASATATPATL